MSVQEKQRPVKRRVVKTGEEIEESESESSEESISEESHLETEEFDASRTDLTELERGVLEIAEEILKMKRYEAKLEIDREEMMNPLADKLFATCVARLFYSKGYSKSEIFLTIKELEQKNWIVTGQRRTCQEILENEIMQGILQLIEESPGIRCKGPSHPRTPRHYSQPLYKARDDARKF